MIFLEVLKYPKSYKFKHISKCIDKVFDITKCRHPILLCANPESGCASGSECKYQAHIKCTCPQSSKVPLMELRWLYAQRSKFGEISEMMIASVDKVETNRQNKALKRKATEAEAMLAKSKKVDVEERQLKQRLQEMDQQLSDSEEEILNSPYNVSIKVHPDNAYTPSASIVKEEKENVTALIDCLLKQKLGDLSYLVVQYLDRPTPKRNMVPVPNAAKASLRYGISPAATAAITSEYLKDLINAGILSPEMSYLACDPSKIVRARKCVMKEAKEVAQERYSKDKLIGLSYDSRKDKHTRAMVSDKFGNSRLRMIKEEHVSVTSEPSGGYLSHFVPDEPIHPEKPAFKVAQGLFQILEKHDSVDTIEYLGGDSTNSNTGWKGGTHAHLEKLIGKKLYWGICNIHTNELPLRHAIAILDGPTASDAGFTGEVCILLSNVNSMPYDPEFKMMPGGEDLISLPEEVISNMSTDQKVCYKLVAAVKAGMLPNDMQEMMCGAMCHARWLTTAQRLLFLWTRKHGLTGHNLKVLELLVRFCLEFYFWLED